jgi:sortase A
MTTEVAAPPGPPPVRVPAGIRALRILGWALITAGVLVLLYLAYSLFFTNLAAASSQSDLSRRWAAEVGAVADPLPDAAGDPAPEPAEGPADEAAPLDPGAAVAVLQFSRPGSDVRPVTQEPLFVVEGVTVADLQRGPGHYPGTALPGQPGNFAVAGHRTTYGAPFFSLDELLAGDEIHVTDRTGAQHVYRVVELRVVGPTQREVIGPDPLGTGRPMLTLTTCHPRFSARQRLIAFAELVG